MAKVFEDTLTDAQLDLLVRAQDNPDALNDAEINEMARLQDRFEAYQGPEMSNREAALAIGKGALNVAGRALDYPGGIIRVAAGGYANALTGKEIVTPDDLLEALKGNAPTTATMLERGGAGEMGAVDLGAFGRYTGRGTLGFAGDLVSGLGASAGLKAVAKGGGLLAKMASAARAPEALLEKGMNKTGTAIYRSGMKKFDRAAELMGKGRHAVSNVLGKHNVWGGARSIQEGADNIVNELQAKVEKAIAQATESGKTIDIEKALAPVRADAKAMMAAQGTTEVKNQVGNFLNEVDNLIAQSKVPGVKVFPQQMKPGLSFKNGEFISSEIDPATAGFLPAKETIVPPEAALISEVTPDMPRPYTPSSANEVKKQVYGLLKDPKFATLAQNDAGTKLMKRGVRGIKEAVEDSSAGVQAWNADIAPLLSAKKKISQELTSEIGRNGVSSVDGALAGANWLALLGKKTADILKGTPARTGGGLLLQNPTTQQLAAQALIEGMPGSDRGNQNDNIAITVERLKRKYGITY